MAALLYGVFCYVLFLLTFEAQIWVGLRLQT